MNDQLLKDLVLLQFELSRQAIDSMTAMMNADNEITRRNKAEFNTFASNAASKLAEIVLNHTKPNEKLSQ